jgi:Flp pilus assembly protein TadD
LYGQVNGDLDTAGRYLRAALDAGNRAVEVYNNLGIVLVTQGFLPDAIDLLQKGLREHPRSPELHQTLAVALQRSGDDVGARHHMQIVQELRAGGS